MAFAGVFPERSKLTVEQNKEMLQRACQNGGWRQLKEDIVKYNEMREQLVVHMENQKDPLFRRYLKMYKSKLGAEEFMKNRLKIYAICNQRAMQECLSVDEMVHVISFGHPQAEFAIASEDENIESQNENANQNENGNENENNTENGNEHDSENDNGDETESDTENEDVDSMTAASGTPTLTASIQIQTDEN